MKVHVPVVIITLLFSFGGLAVVQAQQENGTTPLPKATPSNGSNSQRHVDQPVRVPATKETPSPTQAAGQQQTSPASPNLEKSLIGLTEAVTKLVNKQGDKESS